MGQPAGNDVQGYDSKLESYERIRCEIPALIKGMREMSTKNEKMTQTERSINESRKRATSKVYATFVTDQTSANSAEADSTDRPRPTHIGTFNTTRKYVKLVLPHVALVAVVCLYAVIGAYIFYRLESPNEDRLKSVGKALISDMRTNLIAMIRDGRGNKKVWKDSIEGELYRFNDKIYKAFKEQYVRNNKLRGEKSEKMWTASSALFFAATTMATIGW
ncbi:hypothetical protein TELCIR_00656 [Teladorsagia circumcincta]|uniref:Potassium channel domain-containing protein n=1 Tax=Teladorsagia circumcincta TaxID=45464 RepID=A0A2G9V4A7_TELCI|nr:hypothetical protein TELCIR_00656 [Teladorsagia circumcincta]